VEEDTVNGHLDEINARVKQESAFVEALLDQIGRVIVGQSRMVERLLIGLLADGHILLEGVPGLAKTLSVRALAQCIDAKFQRMQFTPDLLPADLTGTLVYSPKDGSFTPKKGPIFANIILADEINRAPAKVQSALLEAMQERQVTLGETTFPLDQPFMVLATQNPIEQEGTYPLPEAQVDRFMLKLLVDYPSKEEERKILDLVTESDLPELSPVVRPEGLKRARSVVRDVYVDGAVKDYIVNLVFATRRPADYGLDIGHLIAYGSSPRATIYLTTAAKAHAFLKGRGYVTPEDVKTIARDVLRHRIIVSYEAEAEEMTSEQIITRVLDHVEVP
jgi:MoxR-like ATPase